METEDLKKELAEWMDSQLDGKTEEGFESLVDTWGYEEVICTWAERYWYNRIPIVERLLELNRFRRTDYEEPKTIAYYYRCIKNGGAQRVAAQLCNIFAKRKDENGNDKYKVVLITDEKDASDTEQEYFLEENVTRVYLPGYLQSVKENYRVRLEKWNQVIEEQKIDVIINGMWCAPCAAWDWVSIKGTKRKPMYLMHMHNFCCVPYGFEGGDAQELMYRYQLSDGVVSLSECDVRFVRAFNPCTVCIVNPLTFNIQKQTDQGKRDNTILWLGRISVEKQPLDAIHMMHKVVEKIPDAKLIMVGSGNEILEGKIQELILSYGLQNHVHMAGFSQNVDQYYKEAAVYIGTSSYEGFSLTYAEAMAYSIPAVVYDMPWLTLIQDGRGIVPVKPERPDLMADQVVELLLDEEKRKKIGEAGREQIKSLSKIDIGKEWIDFIEHIRKSKREPKELFSTRSNENILFEYLTLFEQKGRNRITEKFKEGEQKKREVAKVLQKTEQKLQTAYKEKSKLNKKLQVAYKENSELNEKLQITYKEKSELNEKLQITYEEKRERGIQIKKQKEEIERINQIVEEQKNRLNRYDRNILIRIGKKIYRVVKNSKKK